MQMHLEKAIFINRAPFDKLELDFNENEIAVLSAANGRGKTTILSHIVDSFYEMARPNFPNEFEEKENKLYRVSGGIYNLDEYQPSFVYLRFKILDETIDYVDIRLNCTEAQYNEALTLENKIPFSEIKPYLEDSNYVKRVSSNFNKKKALQIFSNNIITYFPSYRFEMPGYLNEPYKVKLDFRKDTTYSGYLKNPIEVLSGLPRIANWIMDIVLDLRTDTNPENNSRLFFNMNEILTQILISKKCGDLRFGVGPRGLGATRIQILQKIENGVTIYPSIFNLSSGESSMLCLFGELLRQGDNCKNNIPLSEITGIVIIDEIDKHLHIKLQKEILPKLLKLLPNVQFILSSHSPFLSMGLAEEAQERSKIVDLDNLGVSKDPTTNEQYTEVYNMMVGENDRFKEKYQALEMKVKERNIPLIITEGKTDIMHLNKAKEKLGITDCEVDYFNAESDSKLIAMLEQLCKIKQSRTIIGIFDRDVPKVISDIEKDNQLFKDYSNNVYGFCLPIPEGRENYINISIEFYYTDENLKKSNCGKSLFFDNEVEFRQSASNRNDRKLIKLESPIPSDENTKKIFDENIGTLDWIHSKARFAELVDTNEDFICNFDFSKFQIIFDKIRTIINCNKQSEQMSQG